MMSLHEVSNLGLIGNVAGLSVNLNDRGNIRLIAYDGLGIPNTRRLSQRAPAQNGDTDLGFRIDPRFLDMVWFIEGQTLDHYYTLREQFLALWRPRDNDTVQLVFYLAGGRKRALDVNIEGSFDFPYADRTHRQSRFSAILKASDYRLYDPDLRTVAFQLLQSSGGFPVDTPVPVPIGAGAINTVQTILYANGSRIAAPEFPIITIYGPIENPVVENLTTQEKIELTANGGLSLSSGQFVVIDLDGKPRRDSKTIRDQNGDSVSQYLTTDSDLATFHLSYAGERLPDGTYNDGTNEIRVLGDNVNLNTRVDIQYYDRYLGE